MILLADIGNTRLKWATLENGRLAAGSGADHHGLAIGGVAQSQWKSIAVPQRVVIANVAGPVVADELQDWVRRRWGIDPNFLTPQASAYGVVNAYADPSKLGVDRWASMLAVAQWRGGPACIVDAGTAITIDALAANGHHLGGLIVPGLAMMRNSLIAGTKGIKDISEGTVSLLARDTPSAVAAGTLYAAVAVIDRVAADLAAELGPPIVLVISGGDAPTLLPLLAGQFRFEPDLVIKGLAVAAGQMS